MECKEGEPGVLNGKFKMGFDQWGLAIFFIIMIPNLIWAAVPAPNDILRIESLTPEIDTVASVFQVLTVMLLCILVNQNCKKPMARHYFVGITAATVAYYMGWVLYYMGVTGPLIVLDLCIAPCLAFILFAMARKNTAAVTTSVAFAICHLIYGIANFIFPAVL